MTDCHGIKYKLCEQNAGCWMGACGTRSRNAESPATSQHVGVEIGCSTGRTNFPSFSSESGQSILTLSETRVPKLFFRELLKQPFRDTILFVRGHIRQFSYCRVQHCSHHLQYIFRMRAGRPPRRISWRSPCRSSPGSLRQAMFVIEKFCVIGDRALSPWRKPVCQIREVPLRWPCSGEPGGVHSAVAEPR